jgi:hypothetical protein
VFWLLLAALLLVCVALLGLTLLTLWRRVKGLSRQVTLIGGTVGEVTQTLSTVSSTRPRTAKPCPTCGHRA